MKKIIVIATISLLGFAGATCAADAEKGKAVFEANCNACHSGGKNMLAPGKSLSKEDLKANSRDNAAAINALVTNGSGPMPAYGKLDTISAVDIENVAAFVLQQAEKGW